MNKLTLAVLVSSLVLGGCGSTPKSTSNEVDTNKERALIISSTENYIWQNDESVAYNIAKLAQPSGVGIGMRDNADPKNDNMGRSGSSALSAVSGFLMGGFGGTASFLAMDSKNDSLRDWNPSFVTFYDEMDLDLSDPVKANKIVREDLSKNIAKALLQEYPDTKLEGVFSYKSPDVPISAIAVLSGNICNMARDFGKLDLKYGNDYEQRFKTFTAENTSDIDGQCFFTFESKVSGKLKNKIAVVSELGGYNVNVFIANNAANNFEDGFIIFPDRFKYIVFGSQTKHYYPYPSPVVIGNGKRYFLDISEMSSSEDLAF